MFIGLDNIFPNSPRYTNMQKKVENIIIKHYGKGKKFKSRGWGQCGSEIQSLIRKEEDKIRAKNLTYSEQCDKIDSMRRNIEGIYESFFKVGSMFNWIEGNSNLGILLEEKYGTALT